MEHEDYIPESLKRYKNRESYRVPDGYFDQLTADIHSKKGREIVEQEPWYSNGAIQAKLMFFGLALILIVTLFTVYVISSAPLQFQFEDSYTATQIDSVLDTDDEELIIAQLIEQQTATATIAVENKQQEIDFLLYENIDIELVIEELN